MYCRKEKGQILIPKLDKNNAIWHDVSTIKRVVCTRCQASKLCTILPSISIRGNLRIFVKNNIFSTDGPNFLVCMKPEPNNYFCLPKPSTMHQICCPYGKYNVTDRLWMCTQTPSDSKRNCLTFPFCFFFFFRNILQLNCIFWVIWKAVLLM